jgi:hypothetical protein
MTLSRRAFLGTVAAGLAGAGTANANLHEYFRVRRLHMIEEDLEKFKGPYEGNGFLDQPAYSLDDCFLPPQTPYCPQPGDIMLSETQGLIYTIGHKLSGAVQPSHSGWVFRQPDGSFAIMEAGSFDVVTIHAIPIMDHLSAYHNRHSVWIRPRCVPLTEEQSCRMTEFALKQEGKRFARLRLFAQITPFRARGKTKTDYKGKPRGPDRVSYFCSEMTAEAFVYSGIVPAECARPSATYPCDLFFDHSDIPFLNEHFKLSRYGWGVPARWRPLMTDNPPPAPKRGRRRFG